MADWVTKCNLSLRFCSLWGHSKRRRIVSHNDDLSPVIGLGVTVAAMLDVGITTLGPRDEASFLHGFKC